jgi:MFS transporter, ceroid-lipofuscinosis neuronal protein 7
MGAASANVAICRSYISAASKVEERTFYLSMASLSQVSGFIVGPLLQAAFTKVGKGVVLFDQLPFNMYTLPGWVNVFLGILNICLFVPKLFKDSNIALREQMAVHGKEDAKDTWKSATLDYLSIFSLIFTYFIVTFNLVILESLSTPLSMDQFGITKEETLKYNGVLIGTGALLSCIIFCLLPRICKILKEIDILIWGGLLLMALGKFLYIPFVGEPPKLTYESKDVRDLLPSSNLTNFDDPKYLGCPVKEQPWCEWTPALGVVEFVIGYFFGVIG